MPCGRGGMMNLNFKHWGLLACLLGLVGMSLSAKVERTTVYIFGFSASFTDSVAYITDVQQLDSAYIETKYDFLMDRVVYSDQLQTYLEAVKQMPNSTCTVFFHTKKPPTHTAQTITSTIITVHILFFVVIAIPPFVIFSKQHKKNPPDSSQTDKTAPLSP